MPEASLKARTQEQNPVASELPPKVERAVRMPQTKKSDRYEDIGQELRRMFNDVLSEPIPEDLLSLVKKLETQSGDEPESES